MKSLTTRLAISLGLLCLSWSASAHQPDLSSTILAEKGQNEWVVQIRGALTAFEYEVEAEFGESAYATPEEFRELVIEHLQDKLQIRFNDGTTAALDNGMVKLGHETTVTFELNTVPDDVQSVMVRNAGFNNVARSQSVLYIVKEGFEKKQFILNDLNGHTAELEVENGKFVVASSAGASAYLLPLLLLVSALLTGVLLYLAYTRKRLPIPFVLTPN